MTDRPLTLLLVHAHPDDEASTTGGILAKYAAEGIRTVLVTCTNGELGDHPEAKPGEEAHSTEEVVELRLRELRASCDVLGVQHLELLGYHDSGMMGWEANDAPGSFWSMPVDEAAKPLIAILEKYQPQVVVTYDDYGFYGHPDHIQAHRITIAALDAIGSDAKLYFPAFKRSDMPAFLAALEEAGLEPPELDEDSFGSPDEAIGASIDCVAQVPQKWAALEAHASQRANIPFLDFPDSVFATAFGVEHFQRARPAAGTTETDLFAGVPGRA
jgi:LmbE family N-acetylglucosaminyl deacetylase